MTGDLKRLQGTWTIVEVETDGAKSDGGGSKVALDGANFTTVAMGAEYSGTVALDAKKKPKTFDLLFTSGPHKGEKSLGIYELDGDTWRICLALAGIKTRPKKFATAPGSGFALETLKRGDVAALAEPAAEPGASETSAAEWELLSASIDGAPLEAQFVKYGRRSVHGNLLTVRFGPQVFVKTQFTVDESKSPHQIDYVKGASPIQLGIYKLEGETLTICMAPKGKPRPADFTASKADKRNLTVWKPVK